MRDRDVSQPCGAFGDEVPARPALELRVSHHIARYLLVWRRFPAPANDA